MPELHTFSIVARCVRTGDLGVATGSAIPCVGAISVHTRAAVGAVATQAWCDPYLGIDALVRMAGGDDAGTALAAVLEQTGSPGARQVGVVDAGGRVGVWTGANCSSWAGDRTGTGYVVLGNMLTGPAVLEAMEAAFLAQPDDDLDRRLVAALMAGDHAGGDVRGKQSACVRVMGTEEHPRIDVRVDDHPDAVSELCRVHRISRLQLSPFIAEMPRRADRDVAASEATAALLALHPPQRPGGGGSAPRVTEGSR